MQVKPPNQHMQMDSLFQCQCCNGMLHSSFHCKNCNKIYCGTCVLRFQRKSKDLLIFCHQCNSLVSGHYLRNVNNISTTRKLDTLSKLWWRNLGVAFTSFFEMESQTNNNISMDSCMSYGTEINEILPLQKTMEDRFESLESHLQNRESRLVQSHENIIEEVGFPCQHKMTFKTKSTDLQKTEAMVVLDKGLKITIYVALDSRNFKVSSLIEQDSNARVHRSSGIRNIGVNYYDDTYLEERIKIREKGNKNYIRYLKKAQEKTLKRARSCDGFSKRHNRKMLVWNLGDGKFVADGLSTEDKAADQVEWYDERIGKISNDYKISLNTFIVKDNKLIIHNEKIKLPAVFDIEHLLINRKVEKSVGEFFKGIVGNRNVDLKFEFC
jgi:hypothetical protein